MGSIELTVFTPVYNREKELISLFDSLNAQTNQNFIWLIVDDGSTKNIEPLIYKFRESSKFSIEFIKQENQGKHIAHNTGVLNCKTEYFLCVDSDDTLSNTAIEIIYDYIPLVKKNNYIGLIFPRNKQYKNGISKYDEFAAKLVQIVASEKKAIELAIVLQTSLVRDYLFPQYNNEKFLSEEILYNQLDKIGQYLFINKIIYYSEYLDDGLTNNINRLWINNPIGTYELLRSRYHSFASLSLSKRIYRKFRCALVYDAFCIKDDISNSLKFPNKTLAILCFPLSYLVYFKKFREK